MFTPTPSITKFDEKTRRFITTKTVNILNNNELEILIEKHLPYFMSIK